MDLSTTYLDEVALALVWGVLAVLAIGSAGHALLFKRDPRSALGWIVISLTVPLLGPLCYWCMGVNWIRRKTLQWQESGRLLGDSGLFPLPAAVAAGRLPVEGEYLAELRSLADRVVGARLTAGNLIQPLVDGEEAYPAMLAAIADARHSVHLSTYIFDGDATGRRFVDALLQAAGRGVAVRVIIDALGEKYSRPNARQFLQGSAVQLGRFLPLRHGIYVNLRNHRKILVVDGERAFTGGMNIGDRHLTNRSGPPPPVRDCHFLVTGPVVADLQRVFLEDWFFVTGQLVTDPAFFPPLAPAGTALARAIDDGPDKEFRTLHWLIMGALACARHQVTIVTPYLIPDRPLIAAMVTAALRGVAVTVILPSMNNLPPVHWASRAYLWELLQHGIRVFYQPPPFVHTKLLLVDGIWSLIGSANLDPRSLRLNFELNVEVYDRKFAGQLAARCAADLAGAREVTLAEMDSRNLAVRVRDSLAKLFTPYL
jgi:cardiolipin synthase